MGLENERLVAMWAFWRGFSSSYSETCQCRKQGTFFLLSAVSDLQPKASWLEFSWEGPLQTGVAETAPESCLQNYSITNLLTLKQIGLLNRIIQVSFELDATQTFS